MKQPRAIPREKLIAMLERSADHLKAYRDRQDQIVMALGGIQSNLEGNSIPGEMIRALLASDLRQSKERVYNQAMALHVAVDTLAHLGGSTKQIDKINEVLASIRQLAPEAFNPPAPVSAQA